jgi:uncharacterized protein
LQNLNYFLNESFLQLIKGEKMDSSLYEKAIKCPVCTKEFNVTKVKTKTSKMLKRDSDFCTYFEGVNPIIYDAWVCQNCGYSALSDKFEEISSKDASIIHEKIASRWNKRSYSGERSNDLAIEAFKLALYNAQVRTAKPIDFAKICLRIAWIYRFNNDEKEKDFLGFALKYYDEAFQKERFPVDKLDETTCMYMVAELHRRIGNIDESIKWFSRLISSPRSRNNRTIVETAREQYHLAKEQLEKQKKESVS